MCFYLSIWFDGLVFPCCIGKRQHEDDGIEDEPAFKRIEDVVKEDETRIKHSEDGTVVKHIEAETDIKHDGKVTDRNIKQGIVNVKLSYPVTYFGGYAAKRHIKHEVFNELELLHKLSQLRHKTSIAIDGMNGIGKSRLTEHLNRLYVKTNMYCPDITKGASYNYDPLKSIEYLYFPILSKQKVNVIWDRCCFSNLIFYAVHYLMSLYKNTLIPTYDEVLPHLVMWVENNALLYALKYLLLHDEQTAKIFITNSNILMVSAMLLHRGFPNDIYNSKEYNYQVAQLYSYKFFASLSPDIIYIDLAETGLSLAYIQRLITSCIDVDQNSPTEFIPIARTECIELNKQFTEDDYYLLSTHSTK